MVARMAHNHELRVRLPVPQLKGIQMPSRRVVYETIDQEREYQNKKWDEGRLPLPPSDEVRLIRTLLAQTDEKWYVTDDDQTSGVKVNSADLDFMRKVAAIAVRCMENHGIVER
jgi:hypothetical protein